MSSLSNNILWLTHSKAFCKSQNIPPTIDLLFMAMWISLINVKAAFSVEECDLNPNCSSAHKDKAVPVINYIYKHYAMQACEGSWSIVPPFLTSVLDGNEWSASCTSSHAYPPLPPKISPVTLDERLKYLWEAIQNWNQSLRHTDTV
jgi:hypothetical protein